MLISSPFWGLFALKIPIQELCQNNFTKFSVFKLLQVHAKSRGARFLPLFKKN